MRKPPADDWQHVNDNGLEYSPSLQRWWYQGRIYDELSARHNGLIGPGAQLRQMIQDTEGQK